MNHVNQQGPPCKAKYSWVIDTEVVPEIVIAYGPKPGRSIHDQDEAWVKLSGGPNRLMLKNQWMSCGRESGTKSKQTLNTRYDLKITGVKVCLEATTLERVRNSSLIKRSCVEDEQGKRSVEAVGCKNASVGERSA
ncbi:hypothetical protein NC652_010645 [Populus alba x Populus x berolinensis]|nr:hypothetical protein NC652_010645 [Populus alba x Populus x berolinensis]